MRGRGSEDDGEGEGEGEPARTSQTFPHICLQPLAVSLSGNADTLVVPSVACPSPIFALPPTSVLSRLLPPVTPTSPHLTSLHLTSPG